MTDSLRSRLEVLAARPKVSRLLRGQVGLEKESLRVTDQGRVAQSRHPSVLGSALTHQSITTDFSEALLELVTPPFADSAQTLNHLRDLHRFVYDRLGDEVLWATSMPCFIEGEDSIPLARFGASNSGAMKHIYRRGLAHRYGRAMQTIAGVHFNFSPPDDLWPVLHARAQSPLTLRAFRDDSFFGLLRNYRRHGWLVLYLFGASPALCHSFFGGRGTDLPELSPGTHYGPWATTLRMSDIGYRSSRQSGLTPSMNNLVDYVRDLDRGVCTRDPEYGELGVRDGDEWKQLSDSILQIENEFYGFIRPKQVVASGERPNHALAQRGVAYVEVRALDVNPFEDVGVGLTAMRFLEAFLWWCLLSDSAPMETDALVRCDANHSRVAAEGRREDLEIDQPGGRRPLRERAGEILDSMEPVCALLDDLHPDRPYFRALQEQRNKVVDVSETPSARLISDLRTQQTSFFHYALNRSREIRERLRCGPAVPKKLSAELEAEAQRSHAAQRALEQGDTMSFEEFLAGYYRGQ